MAGRKTKPGEALWQYISHKGLKPLPKTSVSEWADTYRVISQGNAEPGRWRTSRAEYQREIMDAFTQPGIHRVVVKSAAQIGKALDIDTPIPTPDGWKAIGDLQEGDAIFDQNGEICHITAVTAIMYGRPCCEITFSDGSKLVADENHKWAVQTDGRRGTKSHVLTTGEMLPNYKNGNRNTYAIPVAKALNMRKAELPIDPYTLGVSLGEINNKHIPQTYLRAGTAQRWALLQGIMDTDGHATKKGICEITLKSKRLIEDVSELLHTLGVKHTLKERLAVCTNSPSKASFTVWRISFTAYADMPVFSLRRKQERLKTREGRRASDTKRRRV